MIAELILIKQIEQKLNTNENNFIFFIKSCFYSSYGPIWSSERYSLEPRDMLRVGCLIIGADYHKSSGLMSLTGYDADGAQYLFLLPDFSVPYDQSKMQRFILPVYPAQIEAIHIQSPKQIWMTSEDEGLGLPRLFKASIR